MKQFFYAVVICIFALSACTTPFKKTKDGSEYKVISLKSGKRLQTGNFLEMNSVAMYKETGKDTVLFNSLESGMPEFGLYDTANFPHPFKDAFKTVHVGDSIVIKIPADSLIAKGQNAPFMKKGGFIYQTFTITNAYTSKEQVDSVQKIYMAIVQKKDSIAAKEQIVKDDKLIQEYLTKNKISAVKGPQGTYIEIINPGTGNLPDSNQVVMVNYTGQTFDGAKFDSNTDSTIAQRIEPYPIDLAHPQVIAGWIEGLKMLKKGAKARFFIPSVLAYGKRGNGKIKPNENLMFDIAIPDIISQAQYGEIMKKKQAEQMAQQQMMQQLQQQMQQQKQGGK